jgi:carboxylate-amine ligase
VAHPALGPNVSGELIASEIEICSSKSKNLFEAGNDLRQKRTELHRIAQDCGLELAACGTHPFSDWKDQRILNTVHYREVEERLKYLAWRNLTYGMHVHVGVNGRERMISVFNAMRGFLPQLLALSANSPFTEGYYTHFHSIRAQIFTKSFPRCNIPAPFSDWNDYAAFVNMLFETGSISDPKQVWWSLRPHPWFGTIEIRVFDCQSTVEETEAVAALAITILAQLMADYDSGKVLPVVQTNALDENIWRALRFGLDGGMIDFDEGRETSTIESIQRMTAYAKNQWDKLNLGSCLEKIDSILANGNGAQRQIKEFHNHGDISKVFSKIVAESRFDYPR